MKPKVVVVGSSNTDMVVKVPVLPAPGETVLGGTFLRAAGGKGANQAVAAARLGADVAFVARVGNDSLGDGALRGFERDGIRTDWIVRDPDAASGVALIVVDGKGENMIAVASGANARLSPLDVDRAGEAFEGASVVLIQLEVPLSAVRRAAELGRRAGARVILNPAPACELDEATLSQVDVLTPNEGEAEAIGGIAVYDETSARQAASLLRRKGPICVMITLGSRGVLVAEADRPVTVIQGIPVKAVDATAAGDAFNGALACALAEGASVTEAARFANRVAALSVTRAGAQPSLPTREEVEGWRIS
jgi:ribokinase